MIRLWIPSFYDNNKAVYSNTRAVDDGENYEIIGCSCGNITNKLIKGLKEHNIRFPYLHITKISYDNYCGIREIINDSWFSPRGLYCPNPDSLIPKNIQNQNGYKHILTEILNLKAIINDAKKRNIPIVYLEDNLIIEHGDIKIICYINHINDLDSNDDRGINYLNNNTVYYWLPDLKYLATGDDCKNIYEMCILKKIKPTFLKLPNHGKYITREQAQQLKTNGVLYCWDNSDEKTDGKRNCIQSGITYFNCHEDINAAYAGGQGIISIGGMNYLYEVPYNKGTFEEGWVKNFDGWWYRHKDGSWAIGWEKIKWKGKDTWFYFDEDGYTVTEWQYIHINSADNDEYNWFYFDPVNGSVKTGWLEADGLWYYFDDLVGMHKGWLDYEGKKCYFESFANNEKSPAYCNRIALIDNNIWEFDNYCYGKLIKHETL